MGWGVGEAMPKGRKPTPTRLKILTGNPGKRRLNGHEPQPRVEMPSCPGFLDAEARREWKRVAPKLLPLALLTALDRAALSCYCAAWSTIVRMQKLVEREGAVLTSAKGGSYLHPAAGLLSKAMRQMLAFAAEFGMTPA